MRRNCWRSCLSLASLRGIHGLTRRAYSLGCETGELVGPMTAGHVLPCRDDSRIFVRDTSWKHSSATKVGYVSRRMAATVARAIRQRTYDAVSVRRRSGRPVDWSTKGGRLPKTTGHPLRTTAHGENHDDDCRPLIRVPRSGFSFEFDRRVKRERETSFFSQLKSKLVEKSSFVHILLKPHFPLAEPKNRAMSSTAGFMIPCKAAVAWEAGKPLVIQQVEVAPPQAMEVRMKVKYTSLCHTDLYFWEAKGQTPLFPRIFGHEAAGVVESVGEGVSDVAVGDHVLPVFTGECGECRHCQSEESNMCDLLRINTERGVMLSDGKSRFSINGTPINHFLGTSTFSEYTVVHAGCLAKINPLAPLDKVCIVSCGVSTGLGATLNVAKPKQGSSVAIFGLGAVGLAAAEGARIAGASRIIGVDLNPNRFEEAKKFGVTEFVNPKDYDRPVQQVIAEMTDGGVDRSVECTGNINAMVSAFECVHDGWGVAVLVGVPNKDAVFMTKPINVLNERTLKGTFFGNYKPRSDIPSVVDMYLNKKLELDKFITHQVPFSEINKAFDLMVKGEGLRCIINMED